MTTPNLDDEPTPSGAGPSVVAWIVVLVVAGLCCWGGISFVRYIDGYNSLGDAGTPVPSPMDRPVPTPSWSPTHPADEDFATKLRYKLESGVLAAAITPAPVASGCSPVVRAGASFPCWVTYADSKITFTVKIDDTYTGGILTVIKYDVTANEVIVTREAILRKAYTVRGDDRIRCDEFPEVSVVKVDATMAQSCYWKPPHKETRRLTVRATRFWDTPHGVIDVND
jgi:hypothetical protein